MCIVCWIMNSLYAATITLYNHSDLPVTVRIDDGSPFTIKANDSHYHDHTSGFDRVYWSFLPDRTCYQTRNLNLPWYSVGAALHLYSGGRHAYYRGSFDDNPQGINYSVSNKDCMRK